MSSVTAGAMLLSPFGPRHYYAFQLLLRNSDASRVMEYQATPFWLMFLAFWVAAALSVGALLTLWRRADLTHLAVLLPFLYLGICYRRTVAAFATVALPILGSAVTGHLRARGRWFERGWFPAGIAAVVLAAALGWGVHLKNDRPELRFRFGLDEESYAYPVGSVRFIKAAGLGGNMFNSDRFGGYLAFFLAPERRIYQYNHPFLFRHHWRFIHEPQARDKWNINYAILAQELEHSLLFGDGWAPVYAERNALVVVKRAPENMDLIERYEIRHFIYYFGKRMPEDHFWRVAATPEGHSQLAHELASYLAFRRDPWAADLLVTLLLQPNATLGRDDRVRLLKAATLYNPRSVSIQEALARLKGS